MFLRRSFFSQALITAINPLPHNTFHARPYEALGHPVICFSMQKCPVHGDSWSNEKICGFGFQLIEVFARLVLLFISFSSCREAYQLSLQNSLKTLPFVGGLFTSQTKTLVGFLSCFCFILMLLRSLCCSTCNEVVVSFSVPASLLIKAATKFVKELPFV